MAALTLRLVEDPAELELRRLDEHTNRWMSADGGRFVRQRGSRFWWRNEDMAEGTCRTLPIALTMLAFHTPDLIHLTQEDPDAPSSEPPEAGS